jgi:hypothetical protein
MSQFWMRYVIAGIILASAAGVSEGQSTSPHGNWFMQNYRFAGPPPPGEVKPVDPVLSELREVQSTIRNILGRARSEGDYETALAAAAQLAANAQLIGAITEHQQAARAAQAAQSTKSATDGAQSAAPLYLIAMKDKTINAAIAYWLDGRMLNYLTAQGMHVIVRLDLVDRGLSRDLNRQRNVEFRLPE